MSEPFGGALAAFCTAALLLTVTPGVDTALVLRTAATRTSRDAAVAALGITLGCLGWGVGVAMGLGALLMASHLGYTVLRWLGAVYLVWLGFKLLRRHRNRFSMDAAGCHTSGHSTFVTGVLTNLLNPKVGLFYASFLPQFVPKAVAAGPYILMLAAIHALLSLIWFSVLILATRPISAFLLRPAIVKALDRTTGSIFIAFGIGLALDPRRD